MQSFADRTDELKRRVEALMLAFVARRVPSGRLGDAIRYALATEGKRIRPLLAYATADLLDVSYDLADYPAAAMELTHTYSLVHDDLPAMDDDDLRRGRATVHKVFDEATGILVGDALLTYAFELLASADAEPAVIQRWVGQLSRAAGARGMIAGQATDLEGERRALSLPELEQMHHRKSGALIEASVAMVAGASGDETAEQQLRAFGHHIGLAFQVRDDLLDVESTTRVLGKPQGSDKDNNKSTFVSLLGAGAARDRMNEELALAHAALDALGPGTGTGADSLRWLADMIVSRDH